MLTAPPRVLVLAPDKRRLLNAKAGIVWALLPLKSIALPVIVYVPPPGVNVPAIPIVEVDNVLFPPVQFRLR